MRSPDLGTSNHSQFIGEPGAPFTGVKVFSATMLNDREHLGDKVTDWIASHRDYQMTQICVTQSSDAQFHCIAITVFYIDRTRREAR